MDSMKFSIQTLTGAAIGFFLAVFGALLFGWQYHNDTQLLSCIVAGIVITHLVCWYWTSKTSKARVRATPPLQPRSHAPKRSRRPYDNS